MDSDQTKAVPATDETGPASKRWGYGVYMDEKRIGVLPTTNPEIFAIEMAIPLQLSQKKDLFVVHREVKDGRDVSTIFLRREILENVYGLLDTIMDEGGLEGLHERGLGPNTDPDWCNV